MSSQTAQSLTDSYLNNLNAVRENREVWAQNLEANILRNKLQSVMWSFRVTYEKPQAKPVRSSKKKRAKTHARVAKERARKAAKATKAEEAGKSLEMDEQVLDKTEVQYKKMSIQDMLRAWIYGTQRVQVPNITEEQFKAWKTGTLTGTLSNEEPGQRGVISAQGELSSRISDMLSSSSTDSDSEDDDTSSTTPYDKFTIKTTPTHFPPPAAFLTEVDTEELSKFTEVKSKKVVSNSPRSAAQTMSYAFKDYEEMKRRIPQKIGRSCVYGIDYGQEDGEDEFAIVYGFNMGRRNHRTGFKDQRPTKNKT